MPELGTSGSVRGAAGNGRPYRDRRVHEPRRTTVPTRVVTSTPETMPDNPDLLKAMLIAEPAWRQPTEAAATTNSRGLASYYG